jgi:hypothetical protein
MDGFLNKYKERKGMLHPNNHFIILNLLANGGVRRYYFSSLGRNKGTDDETKTTPMKQILIQNLLIDVIPI